MRALIRLILLSTILGPAAAAQLRLPKDTLDWPTPRNVLAINPAAIAVDYVSVHYVRALDDHNAIGGFANFVYRPVGAYIPRGYGGGVLYRYYPGAQPLWRFHYGGQLSWLEAWLTGRRDVRSSGVGIGVSAGWQWLPVEGFAVGFSIGEQYIVSLEKIDNDALDRVFGLRPILSFDLGLAW
jgi:hypothetical protein